MHHAPDGISRRALLAGAGLLLPRPLPAAPAPGRLKVAIFSKHLQFLQGEDLARAAAEIGFDSVDITVRKGGHIEPERASRDLPALVETIRRHGLEVPMITTDIVDDRTPYAADILRVMADLGIRRYRWGGLKYDGAAPLLAQLAAMKPGVLRLAALNSRYNACAMYHTHSGVNLVGASFWDLHTLLEGVDPAAAGVNFDIGHATVEGGLGGWINNFRIVSDRLRGIAVKDFVWARDAKGSWQPRWTPLGEGMVRFPEFFRMVAASGFSGPLQMHFEYDMGTPAETRAFMKRDLAVLRAYLAQAGL